MSLEFDETQTFRQVAYTLFTLRYNDTQKRTQLITRQELVEVPRYDSDTRLTCQIHHLMNPVSRLEMETLRGCRRTVEPSIPHL